MAVGVDDLVETSCGGGGSVRLWERAGKDRGREREKEKEDNINDEEKQSRQSDALHARRPLIRKYEIATREGKTGSVHEQIKASGWLQWWHGE